MPDTASHHLQATVWNYYRTAGRHDLPWRQAGTGGQFDPYHILLSEVMLQQTQVSRVIPKYQAFLQALPNLDALAAAPLSAVLQAWNGLGYNRRAKFLHQAAQRIVTDYDGRFPQTSAELTMLPGIGTNTAGAILAYAFNQPIAFVETNIRTVFLHHYFHDQADISDKDILNYVRQTIDPDQPREWYWALMDYGSYLKQTVGNPNRRSRSYAKQSKFEGSRRQIRGQVIRLLASGAHSQRQLSRLIADQRLEPVLQDLISERLIIKRGRYFDLAS